MFSTQTKVLEQVFKALDFAADRHKNQRRKGKNKIPFINHPIMVANVLIEQGGVDDPVILIGAILHDTIEDTETSQEEIAEIFGQEVVDLVLEVSDNKNLCKADRKEQQIVTAGMKSDRAKNLKIADKVCNVLDMVRFPPNWTLKRKLEYVDWSEAVVDRLRGVNAPLEQHFDETVAYVRKRLESQRES